MLALALGGTLPLYAACILGGLAYGAQNMLLPAIVSEVFGLRLMPVIFPLIGGTGFALGSLLLATLVYGRLYDAALGRHGLSPTDPCRHADCTQPAILVAAAASAAAMACCLLLTAVTSKHYRQVSVSRGRPLTLLS
jgi:hypothetical protein